MPQTCSQQKGWMAPLSIPTYSGGIPGSWCWACIHIWEGYFVLQTGDSCICWTQRGQFPPGRAAAAGGTWYWWSRRRPQSFVSCHGPTCEIEIRTALPTSPILGGRQKENEGVSTIYVVMLSHNIDCWKSCTCSVLLCNTTASLLFTCPQRLSTQTHLTQGPSSVRTWGWFWVVGGHPA